MGVMIIFILVVLGLVFGSFVNALIWRIYQQDELSHKSKTSINKEKVNLSIVNGRSVCVHCGHELDAKDLVPLFSWLYLHGKCRYCHKKIDDSPLVEILMATLFVLSYLYWPYLTSSLAEWVVLAIWLAIIVGLVALFVYDFKHLILPNRIIFPLYGVGIAFRVFLVSANDLGFQSELVDVFTGILVGGGLFYLLYTISSGKWIGGGDVKLGYLIGLVLGPLDALVALLSAFYIAAFTILPLMLAKKVNRKSKIPFGPFLIAGLIIAMLWGVGVRDVYNSLMGL